MLIPDPCPTHWHYSFGCDEGFRFVRAADESGRLIGVVHCIVRGGKACATWQVYDGCRCLGGYILDGDSPAHCKTAREQADSLMAAHRGAVERIGRGDDHVTDAEIDEIKADILRGWAEKYPARRLEDRLKRLTPELLADAVLPPIDPTAPADTDPNDLTDEQIIKAAAYAAWADTFGERDDEPAPDFDVADEERDKFGDYLKRASAEVATWPEWKRNLLGRWPRKPEPAPDFTIERRDTR